jgi:hypothetical protein
VHLEILDGNISKPKLKKNVSYKRTDLDNDMVVMNNVQLQQELNTKIK